MAAVFFRLGPSGGGPWAPRGSGHSNDDGTPSSTTAPDTAKECFSGVWLGQTLKSIESRSLAGWTASEATYYGRSTFWAIVADVYVQQPIQSVFAHCRSHRWPRGTQPTGQLKRHYHNVHGFRGQSIGRAARKKIVWQASAADRLLETLASQRPRESIDVRGDSNRASSVPTIPVHLQASSKAKITDDSFRFSKLLRLQAPAWRSRAPATATRMWRRST